MAAELIHDGNAGSTTAQYPEYAKEATAKSNKAIASMDVQEQILHELRQLNRLQAEIAAEPPLKTQAVWNFVIQLFGLVIGTLFGVFAILAWQSASESNKIAANANDLSTAANRIAANANDLALAANKLALAGLCQSATTGICGEVWAVATASVSIYASNLYSITTTRSIQSTTSASPTSRQSSSASTSTSSNSLPPAATYTSLAPPSRSGPSIGPIVGGVVGGIVGLVIILVAAFVQFSAYKAKQERSNNAQMLLQQQFDH